MCIPSRARGLAAPSRRRRIHRPELVFQQWSRADLRGVDRGYGGLAEAPEADEHFAADGWGGVAGSGGGHYYPVPAVQFDIDDRVGIVGVYQPGFAAMHDGRGVHDAAPIDPTPAAISR